MSTKQLATKIDEKVKEAMDTYCEEKGLKIGRFVEEAILDKLEEVIDINDLKSLRDEPTRSFEDVVKELKKSGKL